MHETLLWLHCTLCYATGSPDSIYQQNVQLRLNLPFDLSLSDICIEPEGCAFRGVEAALKSPPFPQRPAPHTTALWLLNGQLPSTPLLETAEEHMTIWQSNASSHS